MSALLLSACGQHSGQQIVQDAATALGGKEKLQALRSLTIEGDGVRMEPGSGDTPDGPLPVWKVSEFEQTINPELGRMRVERVLTPEAPCVSGIVREIYAIDGEAAWDEDQAGATTRLTERAAADRRASVLHYPVTAVLAGLHPAARISDPRQQGNLTIVDIRTATNDVVTLAIDSATKLPVRVTSKVDQPNLGDVDAGTEFSDYAETGGLKLPRRLVGKIDRWTVSDIRVSKTTVGDTGDEMAAPAAVRNAPVPPDDPAIVLTDTPVAKGVWWLSGPGDYHSVAFEFADHVTLFDVPESAARAKAAIEKARTLVFGKPVTEVVISDDHFDTSAGLRTAVAEGLTIITQRGNVAWFRQLLTRSHTIVADELATKPQSQIRITPVDDQLILKDAAMELDLYQVKSDAHASTMLMGWAPAEHFLIQADLYSSNWLHFPEAGTLRSNVQFRKLTVEKDIPVRGQMQSYADVMRTMESRK